MCVCVCVCVCVVSSVYKWTRHNVGDSECVELCDDSVDT